MGGTGETHPAIVVDEEPATIIGRANLPACWQVQVVVDYEESPAVVIDHSNRVLLIHRKGLPAWWHCEDVASQVHASCARMRMADGDGDSRRPCITQLDLALSGKHSGKPGPAWAS